jgi:hypothetical protein
MLHVASNGQRASINTQTIFYAANVACGVQPMASERYLRSRRCHGALNCCYCRRYASCIHACFIASIARKRTGSLMMASAGAGAGVASLYGSIADCVGAWQADPIIAAVTVLVCVADRGVDASSARTAAVVSRTGRGARRQRPWITIAASKRMHAKITDGGDLRGAYQ